MRLLLLLVLLLAGCPGPPATYDLTMTQDKLIGEEVRHFENVVQVEKRGWLTSDRYIIYFQDGKAEVLTGTWEIQFTPKQP